jgi:hypothetical protein
MRHVVSRRLFLAGGISLSGAASTPKNETVYDFATADLEVRMSVVFYDRYSSSGFRFRDLLAGRRFCLSVIGEQDRGCFTSFTGSLAVLRYRFRPQVGVLSMANLREHVRTIDQDTRLK